MIHAKVGSPLFFLITLAVKLNAEIPFPVYRMKEIEFTGGVAGATSHSGGHLEKAFARQQAINNGWHVGTTRNLPVMIWYDFKAPGIRAAEVSFQPAWKGQYLQGTPTSYQFVGSNDKVCNDAAIWTVLCEDLSDRTWRNEWEVRYCKVKPEIAEKFRCLGIRVLANQQSDGWTFMRNIRMWERIEAKTEEKEEL